MATYLYHVPVIVKYFSDEDEELLPVKKDVVSRVVSDFNHEDLEQYCSEVTITHLLATPDGKKVRVKARTDNPYSSEEEEQIRQFLNGQCSDGAFENGIELPGMYYGYSQRNIIVYTWQPGFDVTVIKSAKPDEE